MFERSVFIPGKRKLQKPLGKSNKRLECCAKYCEGVYASEFLCMSCLLTIVL